MIQISTADIERQIAKYKLRFDPLKDDEIEWRYQPPPFVPAFVQFIDELHCIPSQDEFQKHYIEQNRDVLRSEFAAKWRDLSVRNQKKRALLARLRRAYPSFVRDLYFLALLRENGVTVNYDAAQDVEGGVDLVASQGARNIQVHVFLDSPRSKQGRAKKDRRHSFSGKHIDIVLKPSECKHAGEFWLPTLKHVEMVKQSTSG